MPLGIGQGTDAAIGRFGPTPPGRGPFDRLVRRAVLQTGRFAAAALPPADQNALRQNGARNEDRP